MYRIALFGLPTSGKSTLSCLAARELAVPQINVGYLLRAAALAGIVTRGELARGQLYDDQMIISIIRNELERVREMGFLLDGFPRNLKQLASFEGLGFAENCRFLFLDLDPYIVRSRYLRRMNCPRCRRADYPRDHAGQANCSRCGGSLERRPDATPKALEQKLVDYGLHEGPMIQHLESRGKLQRLSVVGDADRDLPPLLKLIV